MRTVFVVESYDEDGECWLHRFFFNTYEEAEKFGAGVKIEEETAGFNVFELEEYR